MESGPRLPVTPVLKEAAFRTPEAGGKPDIGEIRRVSLAWSEAIAGKPEEGGGIVYRRNRAAVDPKYANVDAIREEPDFKGKTDDEIYPEWEKREKEVADFKAKKETMTPEEVQEVQQLHQAFETFYQIDKAIETLASEKIKAVEAKMQQGNPDAKLTQAQIEQIYEETILEYSRSPNAIDDSATYAPVIRELENIAKPDENGNLTPDGQKAKRLLDELNYDKDQNAFVVKSEAEIRIEAGKETIEASWRITASIIGQELAKRLQEGKLTEEELRKIREHPNYELNKLVTLLTAHEKLELTDQQRTNLETVLQLELRNLGNNDLSRFNHIVDQNEANLTRELSKWFGKMDHVPSNIFTDLVMASVLENTTGSLVVTSKGAMDFHPEFYKVIDDMINQGFATTNDKEFIKNMASQGEATKHLDNYFGINEKNLNTITDVREVSGFAINEMARRNLISEEDKEEARKLLQANLEGGMMNIEELKKRSLKTIMLLAMILLPGLDRLMNEGMEPAPQGPAGPH